MGGSWLQSSVSVLYTCSWTLMTSPSSWTPWNIPKALREPSIWPSLLHSASSTTMVSSCHWAFPAHHFFIINSWTSSPICVKIACAQSPFFFVNGGHAITQKRNGRSRRGVSRLNVFEVSRSFMFRSFTVYLLLSFVLYQFWWHRACTWISSQHLTMTPPTVHLHSVIAMCGKWCFNLIGTVSNNHTSSSFFWGFGLWMRHTAILLSSSFRSLSLSSSLSR